MLFEVIANSLWEERGGWRELTMKKWEIQEKWTLFLFHLVGNEVSVIQNDLEAFGDTMCHNDDKAVVLSVLRQGISHVMLVQSTLQSVSDHTTMKFTCQKLDWCPSLIR